MPLYAVTGSILPVLITLSTILSVISGGPTCPTDYDPRHRTSTTKIFVSGSSITSHGIEGVSLEYFGPNGQTRWSGVKRGETANSSHCVDKDPLCAKHFVKLSLIKDKDGSNYTLILIMIDALRLNFTLYFQATDGNFNNIICQIQFTSHDRNGIPTQKSMQTTLPNATTCTSDDRNNKSTQLSARTRFPTMPDDRNDKPTQTSVPTRFPNNSSMPDERELSNKPSMKSVWIALGSITIIIIILIIVVVIVFYAKRTLPGRESVV
ncbi:hypothetical protein ABFA07_009703 [Porites harrisoni]